MLLAARMKKQNKQMGRKKVCNKKKRRISYTSWKLHGWKKEESVA